MSLWAIFCQPAFADTTCPGLYDDPQAKYSDFNDPASAETVQLVEKHHFTPQVQTLTRGQTGTIQSDIAFVLRAVPNHYGALSAMGRWQARNPSGVATSPGVHSADCYFRRAIAFRDNDPRLHQLYGTHLHLAKRYADAEAQYRLAETLGGENAELFYNYGLLLVETDRLKEARAYADKAYALGYPLPGLMNKLRDASRP